MSEMIERVARAIWSDFVWDSMSERVRTKARREARLAIAAMREPTETMVRAMWMRGAPDSPEDYAAMFTAATDAALTEEPTP